MDNGNINLTCPGCGAELGLVESFDLELISAGTPPTATPAPAVSATPAPVPAAPAVPPADVPPAPAPAPLVPPTPPAPVAPAPQVTM